MPFARMVRHAASLGFPVMSVLVTRQGWKEYVIGRSVFERDQR